MTSGRAIYEDELSELPVDVATSTDGDFRVRSRRRWNMTPLLPEFADLPVSGVFDGELIALAGGRPHFPLVCDELLHRDAAVPLTT